MLLSVHSEVRKKSTVCVLAEIRILAFRLLVCGLREKRKLGFSSFRSPQVSTSIVEPFRSVLSNHSLLKHITA
ncbi:hypothetical protein Tco_0962246 [Tanacetum coccineum]